MSNGDPPKPGERERKETEKRNERAAESREVRDKTAEAKKLLGGQKTEARGAEARSEKAPEALDKKIKQFRDMSAKIDKFNVNRPPEGIDAEVAERLSNSDMRLGLPKVESGYLITKHPDTGETTATALSKLPQGGFEITGNFGYRSGDRVEIRPRYPETGRGVEDTWRKRENKPIVDLYGKSVEMDPRQREREQKMNKLLNSWYEKYLASGLTLSQAHQKAADDALLVLKVTIAPLTGLSIGGGTHR